MGQAKSVELRLKIVNDKQAENLNYAELSRRYNLNYNTVKNLCIAYEKDAEKALLPDYSRCGRNVNLQDEKSYRLVRLVRHFHPDWGVPFILTKISLAFSELNLQTVRTYQKRLNRDKPEDELPRARIPKLQPNQEEVRQPHDEWQIDAKERIELSTGIEACYLNITDTQSNGLLKAKPFPPRADFTSADFTNSRTVVCII
jgi:transposase